MNVRVLGCHGGVSLHHRNVALLVDDTIALDAGGLACALTIEEQAAVQAIFVTHAHMDHVADLGSIVELRAQQGGSPVVIAGIPETLDALQEHFFNDVLWPDFVRMPLPGNRPVQMQRLDREVAVSLSGFHVRAVGVHHSIPSCGFLVHDGRGTLAYSGDTGPTDRFWALLNELNDLRAVITEVSFPSHMAELAHRSGHLTPSSLVRELNKLVRRGRVPIFVYGLKPQFEREILQELRDLDLSGVQVLSTGQQLEF